ncbi:MAG: PilZ domain-containing protein [Candidatus Omnitrophota bacterium]
METLKNVKFFSERRKFPRLNLSVDIEYSVIGKNQSSKSEGVTKNISSGGICVIVYERIDIGDILSLVINLPAGERPIQTEGRVVWIGDFILSDDKRSSWDTGVEFTEISEDDSQRLSKYVFTLIK